MWKGDVAGEKEGPSTRRQNRAHHKVWEKLSSATCRMDDGVWTENIFHCTPDLWLTTVISYVSTIQTTSTQVIAPSASPTYLTVFTLHFYFSMIVTHKYIPYIPTSDTYPLTHVPFKFSPRVFPIARHFNPTCLAQSPPLHTYIREPKGEALHLSIESSIKKKLDFLGTPN